MMRYYLILMIVFGSLCQLLAQDSLVANQQGNNFVDQVNLKSGSAFEGWIIEYVKGEYLKLRLSGGTILRFKDEDVSNIRQIQVSSLTRKKANNPYHPANRWRTYGRQRYVPQPYGFRERGWYGSVNVGSMLKENGKSGISIEGSAGYRLSKYLGLGIGFGMSIYDTTLGEYVYPVFAQAQGFLWSRKVSPMYDVKAGYGMAFKRENNFVTDANGGMLFHPALGVRLTGTKHANFNMLVGPKIQSASFTREVPFLGETQIKDVTFRRWTVQMGLLF